MNSNLWLLGYDIADPRRWQRIYQRVRARFHRLNYSVFVGQPSPAELEQLLEELNLFIDHREDDVRLYAVPPSAPLWMAGRDLGPERRLRALTIEACLRERTVLL